MGFVTGFVSASPRRRPEKSRKRNDESQAGICSENPPIQCFLCHCHPLRRMRINGCLQRRRRRIRNGQFRKPLRVLPRFRTVQHLQWHRPVSGNVRYQRVFHLQRFGSLHQLWRKGVLVRVGGVNRFFLPFGCRWFRILLVSLAVASCCVASLFADLCPACKGRSYTKDISECKNCGGLATSGEYQLCLQCSSKLGQCQHCRKPLPAAAAAKSAGPIEPKKDGVYKSGPWEYRYTVNNAGTRSEGYSGELRFNGQLLAEPGQVNDFYRTPFGPLYWVGQPILPFGGHGWMPSPLLRAKIGSQLADPGTPR